MSDSSTTLRVGGVPEHFNLPWHLANESGVFQRSGIGIEWHDCPGGTGEMTRLIASGELDIAVALSEGAIAAISRDTPMRLLQWFVRSPLIWGVHVPPDSAIGEIAELEAQRFAISRPGSGSHLMASVMAQQQGWNHSDLSFVTVGNLDGAVEAFAHGKAEGFLWERYTTQPLVDRGLMRRVGQCPTPWPAFVLCASEQALAEKADSIRALATILPQVCHDMTQRNDLPALIAERYGLDQDEVTQWLACTRWAEDAAIAHTQLEPIIESLAQLDLLGRRLTGRDCLA